MNLKEIREECWGIARDTAMIDQDRLWPTIEMNRYINRTYKYIAKETKCIRDSITPAVCFISVTPRDYTTVTSGDPDYVWLNDSGSWLYHRNVSKNLFDIHPSILAIDECKWTTKQWKLKKVSVQTWQANPWWEQVVGMPTEYATDLTSGKLAINFRAEDTDTLRCVVRRLPIVNLVNDTDSPEYRLSYHELMLNGILEQMFSKTDAETLNKVKADDYAQKFKSDIDEIKQEETLLEERLRVNYSLDAFR